jgi:capsular exopolysaccharide synthesis family protein
MRTSPSQQLVTLRDARSAVSEAYRSLRTSLLLSAAGSPPRFLLVTSSRPGEGKTTTVVNTATALAQAGKKVLLVDADLRKPRCHRLLGITNRAGLTTFLTGAGDLQDLIRATPVRNLYVLPSGPIPPNPSELLGSARIKELMRMIPAAVDHVLVDSPPVLTVTDATLLAALMDGVVLVVRAGHLPREMLRRAERRLRDVNAKIVGVVLNSVDERSSDYYFYSYHQYGYGDEVA